MTTVLCFGGCENQYSKYAPPKAEICGNWIIYLERTNWPEADTFLQRERQDGSLVIRPDGTFSFSQMPDFEDFDLYSPTFYHCGTGRWWTNTDTQGIAYLYLKIAEMDGQQQTMTSGSANFCRVGGKYFLYFIITDPDTNEVLVLKKVEKK